MKFCGQISIDFPATDYFTIAEHRQRLEDILGYIRMNYPEATLAVKERRERKALYLTPAAPRAPTGALNSYRQD
jgi:hypothetical protein